MNWKIETAQHQFSEVLHAAEQIPQLIYEDDRPIAAVIRADLFEEFLAWQPQQSSLANTFAELRQLCAKEDYTLEISSCGDRPNPFADPA